MRLLVFLCCLAAIATAHPENRFDASSLLNQETFLKQRNTPFGQKYLMDTRVHKTASLSDFGVYFYTRNNRKNPVVIINNDIESVVNSGFFNSSARIISITHGWNNNYKSAVNTDLLDAILDTQDVNLFISDWGSVANSNYITAEFAITTIGECLGDFLNRLASTYKISHNQFTLIGHSLGAHIAGIAAAYCEEKVDLIIGLDPALPLINPDPALHLDPTDADFVHIIHTCGGLLGYYDPLGTADFFPNGGVLAQPGCILDLVGICSHGRSYQYLADSISNPGQKYWAYNCDSYSKFKNGGCKDNDFSFMGTLDPDRRASGSYYLQTKGNAPFALDIDPFNE